MNVSITRRLLVVAALAGALGLVPTAEAGSSRLCPDSAGPPCQWEIGPRPVVNRPGALQPVPVYSSGQQGEPVIWRSGNWLMM